MDVLLADTVLPSSHLDSRDRYGFKVESPSADYLRWQAAYDEKQRKHKILWDKYLEENGGLPRIRDARLTELVRGGIPHSLRREAWFVLSGAKFRMEANKGLYAKLVAEKADLPSKWLQQIEKDLHRTFPGHDDFAFDEATNTGGSKIPQLKRVLAAYSWHNPAVGYCQSMNFIAGFLLLFMRNEEEAFWMLSTMLEDILPKEFFSPHMMSLQVDQRVTEALLDLTVPEVAALLSQKNIPLTLVTTQWLLCIFVNAVPTETALRIWDVFFSEGTTVLFQVAIALIFIVKEVLLHAKKPDDISSTLALLKNVSHFAVDCDFLLWNAFHREGMALVTHKRIESMRQSHLGQVKGNLETQEDKRKLLAEKLAEKREKELREEEPK